MDFFNELFDNHVLWTAILSWFVAQVLKVIFVFIDRNLHGRYILLYSRFD